MEKFRCLIIHTNVGLRHAAHDRGIWSVSDPEILFWHFNVLKQSYEVTTKLARKLKTIYSTIFRFDGPLALDSDINKMYSIVVSFHDKGAYIWG